MDLNRNEVQKYTTSISKVRSESIFGIVQPGKPEAGLERITASLDAKHL